MSGFWSDDFPLHPHGTPQDPHIYGTGPAARDWRECRVCKQWRPPVVESLTVHPADRACLNEQIPTARAFGEPLPDGCLILESPDVTRGTLRLRVEGADVVATLGRPPEPRWVLCDPQTGFPNGGVLATGGRQ